MNKKRKWARAARISAVALSCVLFGGCLFGCGDNSGEQGGETYDPTTSPADVWYAPATQKIRQDLDDTQYNDVKMQSLNVKTECTDRYEPYTEYFRLRIGVERAYSSR